MRLLLDTHIFLWAVAGSSQLKPAARRLIEEADEVHVSAASVWEIPSTGSCWPRRSPNRCGS